MLFAFLYLLYGFVTIILSGVAVSVFSAKKNLYQESLGITLVGYNGIIVLSVLVSLWHIFFPVNVYFHLLIWVALAITYTFHSQAFKQSIVLLKNSLADLSLAGKWLYLVFVIGVILNITVKPAVGDIADYHLQAVQWMEKYKLVPGLGNLRNQLGNYSNWYALQAVFGLSFIGIKSLYVLNGAMLLITVPYFLEDNNSTTSKAVLLIKRIVLVYLSLTLFRKYVGGVTNDYAVTLGLLFLFTYISDKGLKTTAMIVWTILMCAVLVTFKQSAMSLIILALYASYLLVISSGRNSWNLVKVFSMCLFVLLPWIYGTVMSCGYMLFPITTFDFFNLDWRMSAERIQWIIDMNIWWPRAPFMDLETVRHYSFSQWFPIWLSTQDFFSLSLLAVLILLLLLFFLKVLFNIRNIKNANPFGSLSWVMLLSCCLAYTIWYMNGPTPRFIFGYAVFCISFLLVWLFNTYLGVIYRNLKLLTYLSISIAIFSGLFFCKSYFSKYTFAEVAWSPVSYPNYQTEVVPILNGNIQVPVGDAQCWDCDLPCSSLPEKGLEYRGNSIEEGFRINSNKR
jgi:hypothetical protein